MSNNFDMDDPVEEPITESNFDNFDNQQPEKQGGMSRNTKIILGVVGGLALLCCVAVAVGALFVQRAGQQFAENIDNPEAAADTAAEIVDFTLPAGFTPEGGFSLMGIEMVFITNQTEDSIIMLMSFPQLFAGNEADMQQQMEDSMAEQFGEEGITFQFVEAREVTINGSPTTVNIFEGTNDNGAPIRQANAIFESDSGKPSMIMIVAPTSQWDAADLDGFIDSLN